jgi:hypothetical protein
VCVVFWCGWSLWARAKQRLSLSLSLSLFASHSSSFAQVNGKSVRIAKLHATLGTLTFEGPGYQPGAASTAAGRPASVPAVVMGGDAQVVTETDLGAIGSNQMRAPRLSEADSVRSESARGSVSVDHANVEVLYDVALGQDGPPSMSREPTRIAVQAARPSRIARTSITSLV